MRRTVAKVLPDLAHFTGSEGLVRHRILPGMPGVLLSDGAKYVAEKAGAYWLMDIIVLDCRGWLLEGDDFCVVALKVSGGDATLTVSDGNGNDLYTQTVLTDFPEPGIEFYLDARSGGEPVLMLKSEY